MNLDSTYTYNDEGQVTAMTYPSTIGVLNEVTTGASYNYSYDSMNRLGGMTLGFQSQVADIQCKGTEEVDQLITMKRTP